jgi:hypothetical protein
MRIKSVAERLMDEALKNRKPNEKIKRKKIPAKPKPKKTGRGT